MTHPDQSPWTWWGRAAAALLFALAGVTLHPDAAFALAEEDNEPEAPAAAAGPGRIGVDDLLEISVSDLQGPGVATSQTLRVNGDGQVGLLYLGPFKLAGLSSAEAEADVKRHYERLASDANFAVTVRRLEVGAAARVKSGPAAGGDLMKVVIWGISAPGLETEFVVRVQEDGTIGLPYVPPVKIGGLSDLRAAEAVVKAYKDEGILAQPLVNLLKVEAANKATVKAGKVAEGDLLIVGAFDLQGPGGVTDIPVRVGKGGTAYLPYAGPVRLAGLTEVAAGAAVSRAYEEKRLVQRMGAWLLRIESGQKPGLRLGPVEPGDLLQVTVADLGGLGTERMILKRVDADGRITLPYVGAVDLAGRSEAEAAEAVAAAYRAENLIQSPGVYLLKVESAPAVGEGAALPDLPDVPTRRVPALLRPLLEPAPPAPRPLPGPEVGPEIDEPEVDPEIDEP